MNSPLRALIVDDEPAARRLLKGLLANEPDVEVVGTCRHGKEALQWLGEHRADLLFLDIRMPGMDGFEVLQALESPPAVIFVTAYDTFAIRAFEAEAWDYLLKPFDEERLQQTLGRVRKRLRREKGAASGRLVIPRGRGRVTVDLDDIRCILAESNYARFHCDGTSYLSRISLSELERQLDDRRFVRIHRSTIVNVDHLERVDPHGHGDLKLTLKDGRRLTLSRRFRHRFDEVVRSLP